MKNSELDEILRKAPVPDRQAEYWEEFPRRVLLQFDKRDQSNEQGERHHSRFTALRWGFGLATACVALLFGFGIWRVERPGIDPALVAQSIVMLREVEELFPNRVQAIVADEAGVRLVLSEQPDVPASAPLLIRVCQGRMCRTTTTFSGQEIRIAGREFEALVDTRGNVMLVGDGMIWTSTDPVPMPSNLRIEARSLGSIL